MSIFIGCHECFEPTRVEAFDAKGTAGWLGATTSVAKILGFRMVGWCKGDHGAGQEAVSYMYDTPFTSSVSYYNIMSS